jgi:hypothetical protein
MSWSIAFMVVAIVLITAIARVAKARDRAMLSGPPAPDADAARMREEVLRLKERVQVLERVITDNRSSMDLHGEIERLRER